MSSASRIKDNTSQARRPPAMMRSGLIQRPAQGTGRSRHSAELLGCSPPIGYGLLELHDHPQRIHDDTNTVPFLYSFDHFALRSREGQHLTEISFNGHAQDRWITPFDHSVEHGEINLSLAGSRPPGQRRLLTVPTDDRILDVPAVEAPASPEPHPAALKIGEYLDDK